MILTVCADKGSPGVSTTATVLGMVWPGERILLEADPSGGDAALRLRTPDGQLLPRRPSLRGLAVDARSGHLPTSLLDYAHPTGLGVPVIPASDMGTADFAAITRQWPVIASAAARWPGTVIADLGRLQEDSSAGPVAAASTTVLLIARATPEGLYHLRERATVLAARLGPGPAGRSPLAVAAICPARDHAARVRELQVHLAAEPATSGIAVAGWIAEDHRSVHLLRDGQLTKRLVGGDLITSARELTQTLLSGWTTDPPAHPAPGAHRLAAAAVAATTAGGWTP